MTVANQIFNPEDPYYNSVRGAFVELFPPSPHKVMDVGCGRGAYLRHCANRGADTLVGVELRDDVAKALRSEGWATEVISGGIEDLDSARYRGQFDTIVAGFVLEHVANPWRTLSVLRSMLTPDGCVLVSLPNTRHWRISSGLLFRGDWRYVSDGVLDWTHLRFFTLKSMQALFRETGFIVEATSAELAGRAVTYDRLTAGAFSEFLAYGYNFRLRPDPKKPDTFFVEGPELGDPP